MTALDDANEAAAVLREQFARLGLDVHAFGGLAIWSGRPLDGAPYVSIQGATTPAAALLLAEALSTISAVPDAPAPGTAAHTAHPGAPTPDSSHASQGADNRGA